ncbi:transcription initiation factor TFIID subunit 12 isoform X1 [Schistocerca cancellata]|uniref:transcription initiation factor TFIID subunit 12 isoform X1 n=1 Tax=Schistocerca cancellata TaxID=274614 RepID=UPI0021192D63|nr:transcription initiation factor TFIID subunit 12 isoform X1 [Schistocerca cancellata]XP_049782137.1 transcription initiation factor TFIID subunit 12 isoform X1 [Schistocerca cancellata]XP_049782138.1 transcription initiation factor TFIID subunit 12 isoform X1 [Schistocerca cancellata]
MHDERAEDNAIACGLFTLFHHMKIDVHLIGLPHKTNVLTKARLQDLVKEFDPSEQLDEEVEDVLLEIADDFVESAVTAACLLAKHRKANTIEVKDVQLYLERDWNMWQPGFGMEELRPYKRTAVTEAHKQRLALIRKAVKKY